MDKLFTDKYMDRYNKYNETTYKITLDTLQHSQSDFQASNTGFRKLLVTEWMDKVLGELPTLTQIKRDKESKNIEFDFVDEVAELLHDTLAYGVAFVVPEDKLGETVFETLTPDNCKNLEYVYDTDIDKLTYLSYTKPYYYYSEATESQEVIYYQYEHTYYQEVGMYRFEKINLDTKEVEKIEVAFRDTMKPFFVSTRDNTGIWEIADSLINDIDKAYVEMLLDMELSRKMVLLPESFLETGARKGLTSTPQMKSSRLFRTYPNEGDAEANKPVIFNGNYSPEPFINTINIIAHQISLKTGFGKGYFSFDKYEGFKTATEITAGRVDMNLAKTKINNILVKIIKSILLYKNPNKTEKDFKVQPADSIIEDTATYKEKLFMDVTNGLISRDFYLKQSYNKEDVKDIMPSEEEMAYFYGTKNNTGLNTLEQNNNTNNKANQAKELKAEMNHSTQ